MDLISRMDGQPHSFILKNQDKGQKRLSGFRHRTFSEEDILYFTHFLYQWYAHHDSLEDAFSDGLTKGDSTVQGALENFHNRFIDLSGFHKKAYRHVSSPLRKSACKRLNMFLRWMVRKDNKGVDFGLWQKIHPSQLICPLDLHVHRVAGRLALITRKHSDWQTAIELTNSLKKFDKQDPVKYDFALFGLGISGKF